MYGLARIVRGISIVWRVVLGRKDCEGGSGVRKGMFFELLGDGEG